MGSTALSSVDQVWVPTMHSLFPLALTRVQGPSDSRRMLVLSEIKDVMLCSLMSDNTISKKQALIDETKHSVRKSITHEERRVLVLLDALPERSTTNVTLCE